MKNILVTGGSRGIGATVVSILQNNQEFKIHHPTRNELNILDKDSINNYFIDKPDFYALVNTAGINIIGTLDELNLETINLMMDTNLIAPLLLIQKVIPGMKKQGGGHIVNFSSIWGCRSKEYRTLYSMSKFGICGMTRSLARELGPQNILVNAIAPGYVLTEMTYKNVPEAERSKLSQEIPLRRMAQPKEIANVVRFLISEDNSYITGQTLIVDGGFLA